MYPVHSNSTKIFDGQVINTTATGISNAGTSVPTPVSFPWQPTGIGPTGTYYSAPFDMSAYTYAGLTVRYTAQAGAGTGPYIIGSPSGTFSVQQTSECSDSASLNGFGQFPNNYGGFPGYNGAMGVMGAYRQPGVNKSGGLCWATVPSALCYPGSSQNMTNQLITSGTFQMQVGSQSNPFSAKWIRAVYTVASGSTATGTIDCWLQAKA